MKKRIIILFMILNLFAPAWGAAAFVVNQIRVEGLQRISSDTVYSYLPIRRGEVLQPNKTAAIIQSLYKTGFFDHITLSRDGNILVIHVLERPTIGTLKISGNSAIATDKLTTVMKSLDIAEGRVYNRAILEKIRQSLLNQYYQLGRYNARVDVTVIPQARNRVLVRIDISEGLPTKIRRISIIGNHSFRDCVLIKHLIITTPGLFTIFTQTDRYSQEKLDASLESLRNFYLDHGYVKFSVKSSQITMTPDRKSVDVIIVIDEGDLYTIKGYDLRGNLILPREEMMHLIRIRPGDIFSRQAIIDAEKTISDALGNCGYVFANIGIEPKIDEVHKQVFIQFDIKPGKRAYVRHIYFSDNSRTNDEVLRRELQQMEGSMIETRLLEESKHRLSLLPYVKDVQMSVVPVENTDDMVDLNYKVTEDKSAQATFNIGYSQQQHFIFGAGVNQKNFLGTGKTLGINFTRSRYEQFYGISYTNPYFTEDGISRTTSLSLSRFIPGKDNLDGSYTTNEYDLADLYSIPIGLEKNVINRLQLGYGYQNTLAHILHGPSRQVVDFVHRHGRHFQEINFNVGISRDSRDRAVFPTCGMIQALGGDVYFPVTNTSLRYYTVNYDVKWYHPLNDKFILTAKGTVGFGSGFAGPKDFPFFKNYYAGGPGTVRGYETNTLGPRDSNNKPFGGNLLGVASVGVIFPNYISDNLRTTAFVDGGNVYDTFNNRDFGGTNAGSLRFSTGVSVDWISPFGLIDVSLAYRLNPKRHDKSEPFQFSLGANFG